MEIIDAELRLGPPGSAAGRDVLVGAPKKRSAPAVNVSEEDRDATPSSKMQVVGWPPVGSYRKSTFAAAAKGGEEEGKKVGGGLYVKVSMDGAPYLRKVDLRTYGGYKDLKDALDALFGCFSSPDKGGQFSVAYEDKDGDLMLAGDVPWDMFISSCKKLRIMRGSEAR